MAEKTEEEANEWLKEARRIPLVDIRAERKKQLYRFLRKQSKNAHFWCKQHEITRLAMAMISEKSEAGVKLYEHVMSELHSCVECVDMYVKSTIWMENQRERPDLEAIKAGLQEKDGERIIKAFEGREEVKSETMPKNMVMAMYESMLRPDVVEERKFSESEAYGRYVTVLSKWNPSMSNPAIDATKIAYGILRAMAANDVKVQTWAKEYKWREFEPIQFAVHFDKLVKYWETTLKKRSGEEEKKEEKEKEEKKQRFYAEPPERTFYEAMDFCLQRTTRLSSSSLLFERYRIFPRIVEISFIPSVPMTHMANAIATMLERGATVWKTVPNPFLISLDIINRILSPCLLDASLNSSLLSSRGSRIGLGIVSVASEMKEMGLFSKNQFLQLNNAVCLAFANSFEKNKEIQAYRACLKSIVVVGLQQRPAMVPDSSIKRFWVRFVDSSSDALLFRAAFAAEAEYLLRVVMRELEEGVGQERARFFPQRMIVASVLAGHNIAHLLPLILLKTCSLALLDIDPPTPLLRTKTCLLISDILSQLSHTLSLPLPSLLRAAHPDSFLPLPSFSHLSHAQIVDLRNRMLSSVSVYWIASSSCSSSFLQFMAHGTLKIVTIRAGETLESALFLQRPRLIAIGLRSLLWDLIMLKIDSCTRSLPVVIDQISRFIQTEWFKAVMASPSSSYDKTFAIRSLIRNSSGSGSLGSGSSGSGGKGEKEKEEDESIAADLLPLSFILAKHILVPSHSFNNINNINNINNNNNNNNNNVNNNDDSSKKSGVFLNVDAIPCALRFLLAIFRDFPSSPIVKRSIVNIDSWFLPLMQLPMKLKERQHVISEITLLTWKGTHTAIRRILISEKHIFGNKFRDGLKGVIEWLKVEEWNSLLSTPLPSASSSSFPSSSSSSSSSYSSNKPLTTSTWQTKESRPVMNGSLLVSGSHQPQITSMFNSTPQRNGISQQDVSYQRGSKETSKERGKRGEASTSTTRSLPSSIQSKTKRSILEEPVPPSGLTLQERKEADAELQRQQKAKRKREADQVPLADQHILVSDTVADNAHLNSEQKKKMAHAMARQQRMKSVEELYEKVMKMNFSTLSISDEDSPPPALNVIPNTFKNAEEYISAFEPLLLIELGAQMKSAKEELNAEICCTSRPIEFMSEYGSYHDLTFCKEGARWPKNSVFVMWPKSSRGGEKASDQISSLIQRGQEFPHCIGVFVKDKEKQKGRKNGGVKTIESEKGDAEEKRVVIRIKLTKSHSSGISSKLQIGLEWNLCPFFSLSTVCREWQALQAIESLAFHSDILNPSSSPFSVSEPISYITSLQAKDVASRLSDKRRFNSSQRSAVEVSLKTRGFSFIQGPPGTGKTRTLVGLLSALIQIQRGPVLICTPSNSAIDEVMQRINAQGLYDMESSSEDKFITQFSMIRVGSHPDMPESLRKQCLEEMVSSKILQSGQFNSPSLRESTSLALLQKAEIVCCTLSMSGSHTLVAANIPFKSVIIDEAAQAVELSTLIPLQFRCEQCILIGDPNQLPATVISSQLKQYMYERSMFARFASSLSHDRILLLDTQYRMHPQISLFPNCHFYKSKLKDGVSDDPSKWSFSSPIFSSLRFFNIPSKSIQRNLSNADEVEFIVSLINHLVKMNPSTFFSDKIAVITPYQLQKSLLEHTFRLQSSRNPIFADIQVSTVDSFQGREKDIIIFSTVRTYKPQNSVGFLADVRRMNVALTRAKQSLWITGSSAALESNQNWKALLSSLLSRLLVSNVTFPPSQWLDSQQ